MDIDQLKHKDIPHQAWVMAESLGFNTYGGLSKPEALCMMERVIQRGKSGGQFYRAGNEQYTPYRIITSGLGGQLVASTEESWIYWLPDHSIYAATIGRWPEKHTGPFTWTDEPGMWRWLAQPPLGE